MTRIAMGSYLRLRCQDGERSRWRQAARLEGLSESDVTRKLLNQWAWEVLDKAPKPAERKPKK